MSRFEWFKSALRGLFINRDDSPRHPPPGSPQSEWRKWAVEDKRYWNDLDNGTELLVIVVGIAVVGLAIYGLISLLNDIS